MPPSFLPLHTDTNFLFCPSHTYTHKHTHTDKISILPPPSLAKNLYFATPLPFPIASLREMGSGGGGEVGDIKTLALSIELAKWHFFI